MTRSTFDTLSHHLIEAQMNLDSIARELRRFDIEEARQLEELDSTRVNIAARRIRLAAEKMEKLTK